jgi:hypothetical protein
MKHIDFHIVINRQLALQEMFINRMDFVHILIKNLELYICIVIRENAQNYLNLVIWIETMIGKIWQ